MNTKTKLVILIAIMSIALVAIIAIVTAHDVSAKHHNPLSKVKKALNHLKHQEFDTPNLIQTDNPLAKVGTALAAMKANMTAITN